MSENLTAEQRMTLAHAVCRLTGHPEPKGEFDLSVVRNPVERAVEDLITQARAEERERWKFIDEVRREQLRILQDRIDFMALAGRIGRGDNRREVRDT